MQARINRRIALAFRRAAQMLWLAYLPQETSPMRFRKLLSVAAALGMLLLALPVPAEAQYYYRNHHRYYRPPPRHHHHHRPHNRPYQPRR